MVSLVIVQNLGVKFNKTNIKIRWLMQVCANHSMFQHNSEGCKNNHNFLSEKPLRVSESNLYAFFGSQKRKVLSES